MPSTSKHIRKHLSAYSRVRECPFRLLNVTSLNNSLSLITHTSKTPSLPHGVRWSDTLQQTMIFTAARSRTVSPPRQVRFISQQTSGYHRIDILYLLFV